MTTFSGGGFYEKLGVRPFINLEGSLTLSGGFTPSPAVSAAMEEANARFCDMEHLLDGAGRFIADALGVEAAYVAPGGIAALILSAAALMSGDDLELMRRLPETEGMDNEFVVQASNKAAERAFEIAGGRVVYAGDDTGCTAAQLEAAIGPRTVAICQYFAPGDGVLPIEETRAVAQAHGHPARRRRRRDEPPARPVPGGRPQRRPGQLRGQVLRRAQRHRVRVRKQAPGRPGREAGGLTPPRRLRGVRTRLQARPDAGRRHRRRARRVDEHGPTASGWRTRPAC